MTPLRRLIALMLAAWSGIALGHPGHSTVARTLDESLHLLLSPDHWPWLALAGLVAAAFMLNRVRRARSR